MIFLTRVLMNLRRALLRFRGVEIATRGTTIGPRVVVERGRGRIRVGADCTLSVGVVLSDYHGSIDIERWVHIGPYTTIYGHGGVIIGEGTLIAMNCCILSSNHTIPPVGTPIRSQPDVIEPTKIGRDVWLGAGVTVLSGVTIGDGCVVGAGAVVTKDIPPYSIAHGVPARVVGDRR
jgi:acetyltransferase-like isoleucine patch superfamily enzyme